MSCGHTWAENAEVNGKSHEEWDLFGPVYLGQTDKNFTRGLFGHSAAYLTEIKWSANKTFCHGQQKMLPNQTRIGK